MARDAIATRARLLAAAREVFSCRGYGDVGVREIATLAGCDPALIRRYFGTKEALFAEALAGTLDISMLLNVPRERFGVRAMAYFRQAENEARHPLPMLIFATADPVSRAVALRLLEEIVIAPIAAWLGGPRGAEFAARISVLCSGYFLYQRILPLEVLEGSEATRGWLASALQAVVDEAQESLPGPGQ